MEEKQYIIKSTKDSFEVNLKPVWDFLKRKYYLIIITAGIFFILGITVAILSPVEYTSSIQLIQENPQSQNIRTRNLFRNMNIFGMNDQDGFLGAAIYPDIVKSTPFMLSIIDKKVFFAKYDSTVNIEYFFNEIQKPSALDIIRKNTIGMVGKLRSIIEGKPEFTDLPVTLPDTDNLNNLTNNPADTVLTSRAKPLKITRKQLNVIGKLKGRITVSVSEQYVVITTKMPDPIAAAALTDMVFEELTEYITDNKTSEAMQEMLFIQERTEEAKAEFYRAQNRLAEFRDRNMNITTARAKSEEQRLQAEYELAFNLYKTLSQQLEQAKIKVKENTPVFEVLEPVKVPLDKSEPERFKIVFMYTFFGLFFGVVILGISFLKLYSNSLIKIN